VTLLLFAGAAHAQSAPATPPVQSARHTDAHADRVLLVPTAETHPQGTLFATSYEILVFAVGYAFTDRMQASVTGTTDGHGGLVDLDLKANLLRSRWLRLAALTSIDFLHARGDEEDLLFGRPGVSAQLCFELACRTSLSMHAMLVLHDEPNTLLPFGFGAGFVARMSSDVSVLLEYDMLVNASRDLDLIDLPVFAVGYGARISAAPSWSLDLALIRRMQSDHTVRLQPPSLFDLLGVPFIAFTFRGVP
jgi:hypothetical protein